MPGLAGGSRATSRAALHVRWEHEWILPPLSVPNLTCLPTPEALLDNPAVSLFVQRAQAVRSDFGLTSGNARAVAELCLRLDGLPLAIELAAAWIKVVSPNALLARLERRFDLLVGGRADQTARHQALRAFNVNYDELPAPPEAYRGT